MHFDLAVEKLHVNFINELIHVNFRQCLNMHDHAVKRQLLLVARPCAYCKLRVAEIYKRRAERAGELVCAVVQFVTWTDPVN